MIKDSEPIGIINEVGDLGLGFSELSENEQKIVNENNKKDKPTK